MSGTLRWNVSDEITENASAAFDSRLPIANSCLMMNRRDNAWRLAFGCLWICCQYVLFYAMSSHNLVIMLSPKSMRILRKRRTVQNNLIKPSFRWSKYHEDSDIRCRCLAPCAAKNVKSSLRFWRERNTRTSKLTRVKRHGRYADKPFLKNVIEDLLISTENIRQMSENYFILNILSHLLYSTFL